MATTPSVGPRRRIYFLSGFDPRGGNHYYKLFAKQLQVVAANEQQSYRLRRRRQQANGLSSCWMVEAAGEPLLELVFLHWDDIARDHWPRSPWVILRDVLIFAWWYVAQGGLLSIARMSPSVALCGFYPILFVLTVAIAVVLLAVVGSSFLLSVHLGKAWVVAVVVCLAVVLLHRSWIVANQLGVVWLFRSIRFTHQLGQARDGALRARVAALSEYVIDREHRQLADDILVVGHSSGSFVMAMLAAAMKRHSSWAKLQPRLRLLSLGQNLANLAVHKRANLFHRDLLELAADPRPSWIDVTSRDDFLCFAGVNPYRSCGLLPSGPDCEDVSFDFPDLRMIDLAPARGICHWWQLLGCQFDLHFDYLRARDAGQLGFDFWSFILSANHA